MNRRPTLDIHFDFPGLLIASVEDTTFATGATLFYFPKSALAQVDVRGGSAATSETNLLDAGSYSNQVDGILLTGGSTMGLACGDGVREALFKERSGLEASFDSIPSVPTTVIYDYGIPRKSQGKDPLVYPDRLMGLELMKKLSPDTFTAGRAGAGVSATANKVSTRIWGGQGFAKRDLGFGKVAAAVVVNALGDLNIAGLPAAPEFAQKEPLTHGTNTTISIVVTDIKLTRDGLKRLAVGVHTSMARSIFPFHTEYDGDTHFAVSTSLRELPKGDAFMKLNIAAADAMRDAIEISARTANRPS